MPISSPLELSSGPPELPGLIAASVWTSGIFASPTPCRERPTPETIPVVTVEAEAERVTDGDDLLPDPYLVGVSDGDGHDLLDLFGEFVGVLES